MFFRIGILTLCSVLIIGCSLIPSTPAQLSPTASAYLEEVFAILEQQALHRETIDWKRLRWQAFQISDGAETTADTYDALRFVVSQLADNHSRFVPAAEANQAEAALDDNEPPLPRGEILANRIGYLWLPYLIGDGPHAETYAHTAQALIRQLDATEPCGWIIDLSDNLGGNMWPMIAGVGPILGAGPAGQFVDPDGTSISWSYEVGAARLAGEVMANVDDPLLALNQPNPVVAVLTSERTTSSGEAVAVAFRGRPNTRSFGEPTAGLSTGNQTYELSDGAILILTEVRFADRTGIVYGQEIIPDERVRAGDAARARAIAWLGEQPACAERT